ncbi:MAG TPA: polyphenol oxidase family protein [Actinomycetota bacterium]|nr:polyphenol oxidase family protein [Actinomycetota bacterium]
MLRTETTAGVPIVVDAEAQRDGILVAFAGRDGGVSRPPYDSLNLSSSVGDDDAAVDENRQRAAAALGLSPDRLVLARQVHGSEVIEVRPGDAGVVGACDVLVSRSPGPVVTILTADCVPIVLRGRSGIAAVHAGWRGLVAGAVAAAAAEVEPITTAWVGPSIHACCYEVGREVVDAFERAGLPVAARDRVDPGRAAVVALRRLGVVDVRPVDACTSCDTAYFSYRRDGITGRQGSFAAFVEPDR